MTGPVYEYPDDRSHSTRSLWVALSVVILLALGAISVVLYVKAHHVSREQAIVNWRDSITSEIRAVDGDLDMIGEAARVGDLPALTSACIIWENDIDKLRKRMPSPDAELTNEFNAGLDDYSRSAELCQHANTRAEYDASAAALQSGNEHFVNAGQIVKNADLALKEQKKK